MRNLLAMECSADLCSVAIRVNGEIRCLQGEGARNHNRLLFPMIDQLLREQGVTLGDLSAIAFSAGPGSFTGIRLAASVAKGLGYAAKLPVIPVSSLAAIAQAFFSSGGEDHCRVVVDARMGGFYVGEYEKNANGMAVASGKDRLLLTAQLSELENSVPLLTANGVATAADVLHLASVMLEAGEVCDALAAEPFYLRDSSIWKTVSEQKNPAL
jgi:tRNA threonylcarbamoyladenosine biosynthesis protein TsaB